MGLVGQLADHIKQCEGHVAQLNQQLVDAKAAGKTWEKRVLKEKLEDARADLARAKSHLGG